MKRAVGTMKLGSGLHVLPLIQKAHEVARAHRLDLSAQPSERQPVDACQDPAITPLDLGIWRSRRRCEAAAEYLALCLEPQQGGLDHAGRQGKPPNEPALRVRSGRLEPAPQDLGR